MITFRFILPGVFSCLAIFLFVTAPAPLPEHRQVASMERQVNAAHVFTAVNAVNQAARQIHTSRIVGARKKAGLGFGEDWAEQGVEKARRPPYSYG